MLYNDTQTIAAISTAVTESGIGIVRISGEQAIEIADRIYKGKNGKKLADQKTHTIMDISQMVKIRLMKCWFSL